MDTDVKPCGNQPFTRRLSANILTISWTINGWTSTHRPIMRQPTIYPEIFRQLFWTINGQIPTDKSIVRQSTSYPQSLTNHPGRLKHEDRQIGRSRVELGLGVSCWSPGLYEDVTVTFEQVLHCQRINDVQPPHHLPVRII